MVRQRGGHQWALAVGHRAADLKALAELPGPFHIIEGRSKKTFTRWLARCSNGPAPRAALRIPYIATIPVQPAAVSEGFSSTMIVAVRTVEVQCRVQ